MDWSAHPLGPPAGWPDALRVILEAVLASPCPMWVGWGPDLRFFGNDACLRLLGWTWEDSAGLPAAKVLLEFWSAVQGPAREVVATGSAAQADFRLGGDPAGRGGRHIRCHCSRFGTAGADQGGLLCILEERGAVPEAAPTAGDARVEEEIPEAAAPAEDPRDTRARAQTRQLEDVNARYDAVFEQDSFAGLLSLDGVVLDVNRAWLEASGFSREEIIGKRFWEAGWWARSKGVQAWVKIGFAEALQGVRFRGESRFFTADGRDRRIALSLTPVRRPNGEMTFIVPSGHDVTDRHQSREEQRNADVARETEARFRRMANAAPVLIWMADTESRATWFNQQWLEFVGGSLERELGSGWLRNVHADDAARCVAVFNGALTARRPFEMEFRLRRHDGEFRWVLDHGVPAFAHDGSFAGFIGSCIDITERKQAELAVQRLAAIVESSGDAILAVDLDGFVTSWNRGAENLYGYAAVEMIGQTIQVIVPPARRAEDAELVARIVGGDTVEHRETQRRRRDGALIDISVSMSPIRDEAGTVVGVSRIARDISARRRTEAALRESEARFRMLADNIAQFAWTADERGNIFWFNQRWIEYTGMEPAAGLDWPAVLHPDHRGRVEAKFARCIADGVVWEDTFPLRRHDGVCRWFLSRAVPIRDAAGSVVQWFGTNTDITEMREIEQELERARDDALEASRAKDDFLAALSHELRTPLNPVLLLSSEAAEDPMLPAQVRADFAAIRKQVSLEARLIDDLLDLTRISRGLLSLDFRAHDVHAIVRDAIATVAGDVAEKSIALTVHFEADAPRVRADAVRLQQAFWNVLKNAVKFTPVGGRIGVASRTVEGATVEIVVTDTGIGISAAELPRIFEAFSQGDHASRVASHRFGGLGLGLTISRRVIEMHGGRIEALSPGPGAGSSFIVTLPLAVGDAALPEPKSSPPAASFPEHDGRRVLLVEDHGPTRTAITRLLVRRGFAVIASATATEARSAMRSMPFDLLVSDIGLPDGNGCDLMRECAEARGVPGIALTGYGMEQDVARSHAAGFSAHLTKPINVQALDRAIAGIMEHSAKSSPAT